MIHPSILFNAGNALLAGALLSLEIAFLSTLIGIIGGTLLALMMLYGPKTLQAIGHTYTTIIRGTPMLVQMMMLFFVLPSLGISIPSFWTAVLALGMNSTAYISKIMQAGIQSVGIGQIEAAKTLGFTQWQISRFIVLPQAFRTIFPAIDNECVTLIKDSSLASVIGVAELNHQASIIMSTTYDALTTYSGIALMYLVMTGIVSGMLALIGRKMHYVKN